MSSFYKAFGGLEGSGAPAAASKLMKAFYSGVLGSFAFVTLSLKQPIVGGGIWFLRGRREGAS